MNLTHIWFLTLSISVWKSDLVGLYILLLSSLWLSCWYKGWGIDLLKSTYFNDFDFVILGFSRWIVLLVEPFENLDEIEDVIEFKFWKLISTKPSSCSTIFDIWSDSSICLGTLISWRFQLQDWVISFRFNLFGVLIYVCFGFDSNTIVTSFGLTNLVLGSMVVDIVL